MENRNFSIGEAIGFGWKTTTKNILFFIVLLLVLWVVSLITQGLTCLNIGNLFFLAVFAAVAWVINSIVTMGVIKISLKFCDNRKWEIADIYSSYPLVLNYIAAVLLFWVISAVGLILLIIPGIIFMLRLQFFSFFIVDRHKGPIEALKASWEATRGKTLNLLALWFTFLGVLLLGLLALLVGLVVAVPVVMLAMAFTYRALSGAVKARADAGAAEPPPAAAVSAEKPPE